MIFNIAICDDNNDHLVISEFLIEDLFHDKKYITYIETFLLPEKLKETIIKNPKHYDFIFLDIEMSNLSGLDLGKIIRQYNKDVILIYVTSYTKYSIEAYDNTPFHYLVKPIKKNKLSEIIDKALEYRNEQLRKSINKSQEIDILINGSIILLDTATIKYIEKQRNKCIFFTKANKYESYITLERIEKKLQEKEINNLIRCHQTYIVNLQYVWKYESIEFILRNEISIPISRKYSKMAKSNFISILRSEY